MSTAETSHWKALLTRLNALTVRPGEFRHELPSEALSTGWCGSIPALERDILRKEAQLGVKLPPSYRAFLSTSNGWAPFDGLVERLLPVEKIERFRDVDRDGLASILRMKEDGISDGDYLDYENPKHSEALRPRYYPESILVGTAWGTESERILLNPSIISIDGEWETMYFASWIPGNVRYRSFRAFVESSIVEREEGE